MSTKPTRTFVYLALVMVFLLVVGLIVVGMLVAANRPPSSFDLTRESIVSVNIVGIPSETLTQMAVQLTQTALSKATFTPILYTADMSPTAAIFMNEATATAYQKNLESYFETATQIARLTSPTPVYTPTYPYDPELYRQRQIEEMGLMTGGGPTEYARFYATETALVAAYQAAQRLNPTPTATVSLTPSPTALATFTPVSVQGCAWQWARQDLPELSIKVLEEFIALDMPQVEVRAEAYGENCLDPINTSSVKYFAAMTSDFYLTYPVDDLSDENALADFVVQAYDLIRTLPDADLPARPGYLDITFTGSSRQSKHLRMMFDEVKAALEKKLSGAGLLDALGGLR